MVKERQTVSNTHPAARHPFRNTTIFYARLARRAFRRTGQLIRWRRWNFHGVPVLFANSFPKSGTHLLTQVLGGFSQIGPAVVSGLPAVVTFWGDSGWQRPEAEILADLAHFLPGDTGYGHLFATPAMVKALNQDKFAPFFIIRDPRDVVVSHVHYVTEMEPNHVHHIFYTQMLQTFEDRLRTSILGLSSCSADDLDKKNIEDANNKDLATDPLYPSGTTVPPFPDISTRFQPYLGWCQQPAVLTIRYEEFIDDQSNIIHNILNHAVTRGFPLDVEPEKAVKILEDQINPQRSPTFRTGKTGGWREAFSPEIKKLFKETAGELLITLGYEKDYNW